MTRSDTTGWRRFTPHTRHGRLLKRLPTRASALTRFTRTHRRRRYVCVYINENGEEKKNNNKKKTRNQKTPRRIYYVSVWERVRVRVGECVRASVYMCECVCVSVCARSRLCACLFSLGQADHRSNSWNTRPVDRADG